MFDEVTFSDRERMRSRVAPVTGKRHKRTLFAFTLMHSSRYSSYVFAPCNISIGSPVLRFVEEGRGRAIPSLIYFRESRRLRSISYPRIFRARGIKWWFAPVICKIKTVVLVIRPNDIAYCTSFNSQSIINDLSLRLNILSYSPRELLLENRQCVVTAC